MKKILHIMHDDKFNDRAVIRFDAVYPGGNIYAALHPKNNDFKYIKSSEIKKFSYSQIVEILVNEGLGAVVFHSLPHSRASLFRQIPNDVKIVWIGWGYDYYPTLLRKKFHTPLGLLEPITRKKFIGAQYRSKQVISSFEKIIKRYTGLRGGVLTDRDYSRVDFFIPVLRREWQWARDWNPLFGAKYSEWKYSLDSEIDAQKIDSSAENILIGNSATLTNNHLDAFKAIADFRIPGEFNKVICPLNYGDMNLAVEIANQGKYYFGNNFCPLTEFLEKNKYWEYMRSCHTVVMNHIRQQAGGNVNRAFSSGARVVLNPRSVYAEEYADRGLNFDVISSPSCGHLTVDTKLSNMQLQREHKMSKSSPDILRNFINELELT